MLCSVLSAKSLNPLYSQGPSVVNLDLSASPDHTQETLKYAVPGSFCRHGKELSLLVLLFMINTAAELEDLRYPCRFDCGLQNLKFNCKSIKFPVCFPGVTVRMCADRLLSSEAISRHTKTMPQPKQGWPFPIHLNGVLNLKPNYVHLNANIIILFSAYLHARNNQLMHSFNLGTCKDPIQTPCHFDSLHVVIKSCRLALWLFLIIHTITLLSVTLKTWRWDCIYIQRFVRHCSLVTISIMRNWYETCSQDNTLRCVKWKNPLLSLKEGLQI